MKKKADKIDCSNDRMMIEEGLRLPKRQVINNTQSKPREMKQHFRKLSKRYLLENKIVLKFAI